MIQNLFWRSRLWMSLISILLCTFFCISIFPSWFWSFFINFRFSGRKSQSQQKLTIQFTIHFYNTVSPKKLHSFYESQLTQHFKKYTPVTQPKTELTVEISSKHVSGWCQKKHLHCTVFTRPRTTFSKHLESKCLYIPVNIRKKIFVSET